MNVEIAGPSRADLPLEFGKQVAQGDGLTVLEPVEGRTLCLRPLPIGRNQPSTAKSAVGVETNTLVLDNLIIHRVPQKAGAGQAVRTPTLSDIADPQTNRVRQFFRQRIADAMSGAAALIERDPGKPQGTADAVAALLADRSTLVAQSRVIANRLFDVQDRRNTEGILVIGTGRIDGSADCVTILKLEHEAGIRAEEEHLAGGQIKFTIVVHDDLLLTPKTILFKGALFKATAAGFEAKAADLQSREGIADFFLETFLGCRLVKTPAVTTETFFTATQSWIGRRPEPEKRAQYELALVAHLHSAATTINPSRFARDTFAADEHQDYLNYVVGQGVPDAQFEKDITPVAKRTKRIAFDFASGIKLVGPTDAMRSKVQVRTLGGNRVRVTIEDEMLQPYARG